MKYNNITGIILCGGKSSRMGCDKAFLKIGKNTIIEVVYHLLNKIFQDVIIVANRPEDFRFLTNNVFRDIYKDMGPLGGIHTGLCYTHTERNFFTSCDMPFISKELIQYICNYPTEKMISVPKASQKLQTMCAIYERSCIESTEIILSRCRDDDSLPGLCSPMTLLKTIVPEIIKVEDLSFYHQNLFFNMNNPDDYQFVLSTYNLAAC